MYPDLSYIFHAIFGTSVGNWTSIFKTFGLFLTFSFFVSAYFLYLELRRKEAEGIIAPISVRTVIGARATPLELLLNAGLGFVLGFKLLFIATHWADFRADASSVVLSAAGSWLGGLLGAIAYGTYQFWLKKQAELPEPVVQVQTMHTYDRIGDITMVAAASGIFGAKIFAVFEDMDLFLSDPLGQLLSGSGLAIYGGLIGGFIGVFWYIKKLGIRPIHVMDAVAPALIMGYATGRLGCHFSGDGDWGIANELPKPAWFPFPDWLWAFSYPHNVLNEGIPIKDCVGLYCKELSPAVFPTPLYETAMALLIAAILWALRKRIKTAGVLFFIYMILNGLERFLIEKIRINPKYDLGFAQATQAEVIAVLVFLGGIGGALFLWLTNKPKLEEKSF